MNSKLLFLVFGLLALGCVIEAKDFFKKFAHKKLSYAPATADKALGHIRKRRDAEESTTKAAASSEEITDEEAMALLKFFIAVGWEANKLELLTDFLNDMSDHETNLTVIGWQRIVDDNGDVQEVNTVQLVIPPKPQGEGDKDEESDLTIDDDDEDEDDDRALPYGKISELKEIFTPFAQVGIPISVTMEEYNRHGGDEALIYMDADELYINYEGFSIYNKTVKAPIEYVEHVIDDFIKQHPDNIFGEPSVLRYDVDGHFNAEKSHIFPYLLGGVDDFYETPDEILFKSPNFIAQISQQYPHKEIPKQLAVTYNKEFPEYNWKVLVDPEHYYVTRDVSVSLSYDNFDFDESSDVEYVVYGVKKTDPK